MNMSWQEIIAVRMAKLRAQADTAMVRYSAHAECSDDVTQLIALLREEVREFTFATRLPDGIDGFEVVVPLAIADLLAIARRVPDGHRIVETLRASTCEENDSYWLSRQR